MALAAPSKQRLPITTRRRGDNFEGESMPKLSWFLQGNSSLARSTMRGEQKAAECGTFSHPVRLLVDVGWGLRSAGSVWREFVRAESGGNRAGR